MCSAHCAHDLAMLTLQHMGFADKFLALFLFSYGKVDLASLVAFPLVSSVVFSRTMVVPSWVAPHLTGKPAAHNRATNTLKYDLGMMLWSEEFVDCEFEPILAIQTRAGVPCLYVALKVHFEGAYEVMSAVVDDFECGHVSFFRLYAHPTGLRVLRELIRHVLATEVTLRGPVMFADLWADPCGTTVIYPHCEVFTAMMSALEPHLLAASLSVDYAFEAANDEWGRLHMVIYPPDNIRDYAWRCIGPEMTAVSIAVALWTTVAQDATLLPEVFARIQDMMAFLQTPEVSCHTWWM